MDTAMNVDNCLGRTIERQSGVGLIEVLIALLVFAVGVLGMASMQLAAKRSGYEATQRSIATSLARDILERMRSNPGLPDSYIVTANEMVTLMATSSYSGLDCGNPSNVCDPNDLAAYDLHDWSQLLTGATETVTIDSTTSNVGGLLDARACITNTSGNIEVAIAWRGVSELENSTESDCGNGATVYGTDNVFRRVLVMTSFIAEP